MPTGQTLVSAAAHYQDRRPVQPGRFAGDAEAHADQG
jgi:hypothetical protein